MTRSIGAERGGTRIWPCYPLSHSAGLYAFLRWCASQLGWLDYFESRRRTLHVFVLSSPLKSGGQPLWGLAKGTRPGALARTPPAWADIFLSLEAVAHPEYLAETFVHELRHAIDLFEGARERMTRDESEELAHSTEEEFWRRVPKHVVVSEYARLVAADVRRALECSVRLTGNDAHAAALASLNAYSLLSQYLASWARNGVAPSDDLLRTGKHLLAEGELWRLISKRREAS